MLDFICDRLCLLQGGARRHEDLGEKDPLILIGKIGGGQPQKQKANHSDEQNVDNQVA